MKSYFHLFCLLLLFGYGGFAQSVAINKDGSTPHPSAILDLKSSTKGLLIPRMRTTERIAIINPAKGLMVFDTDTDSFWFFDGSKWRTASEPNFWTLDNNNIVNNNSGNVGIGSSSFQATFPRFPLSFPALLGDKISLWDDGNADGNNYGFGIQEGLLQIYTNVSSDDIAFGSGSSYNFSETVRIKGNGNVGIGTVGPRFPLSFNSNLGEKISLWDDGNSAGNNYGLGIQDGLLQIHTNVADDAIGFGFGSSNNFSEVMRINGNGNLGIGTISPRFPLSFPNVFGDKISLWDGGPLGNYGIGIQNNLLQIHANAATDDIVFGFGTSSLFKENMRIKGNGNVGIGANQLLYKLNVNGTIRAKEVRVETGWADYVFADSYQLRPLSLLELYIKNHKHLPGIPSADDMEQNGLELGKTQAKMMEKIEELTLYAIEANKTIEQLKNRISKLEKHCHHH